MINLINTCQSSSFCCRPHNSTQERFVCYGQPKLCPTLPFKTDEEKNWNKSPGSIYAAEYDKYCQSNIKGYRS
jgi:hypothetical protein